METKLFWRKKNSHKRHVIEYRWHHTNARALILHIIIIIIIYARIQYYNIVFLERDGRARARVPSHVRGVNTRARRGDPTRVDTHFAADSQWLDAAFCARGSARGAPAKKQKHKRKGRKRIWPFAANNNYRAHRIICNIIWAPTAGRTRTVLLPLLLYHRCACTIYLDGDNHIILWNI